MKKAILCIIAIAVLLCMIACAEDNDYTVYVTPTGGKYHKYSCSTIKNSKKTSMLVSVARSEGYTACGTCKP